MHPSLMREFGLAGRTAVVTGAASGIGRETAHVLAQAGAAVVLADLNEAGLAETARLVEADGGVARIRKTDVTVRAEVEALADEVAAGGLDAWVNAAGVLAFAPILETSEADVDKLLSVNLKGVYWGVAAAGRVMTAQGRGSIVNIASAGADAPAPGLSVYSITKAGVNMLTRTAAAEFAQHGVRVNSVAPGFVDTPMVAYRFTDAAGAVDQAQRDELLRQRAAGAPLGRIGTARDMALAILYLASDAGSYVTGQVLRPNGGVAMV